MAERFTMGKTMIKTITRKTLLASALSVLLPASSFANVLITEYVEGSSNNKAIEISNLGSDTVDLAAEEYKIEVFNNGKTESGYSLLLTGSLAPNASFVIYNSGAASDFVFEAPNGVASTVTYFNGDDALVLTKAGVVVDSFGQVGQDPGSAWTDPNDASFTTKDRTLRRLNSVVQGDASHDDEFPGASNEWLTLAKDTADGLGCPGENACALEPQVGVLIISEYIEGSSNNKALEVTNIGNAAIELDADTYELALYSNGSEQPGNTETLTGTLEPQASIVIYNSGASDDFKFDAPKGVASTVTYFNGDDAIVLTKNGEVIDSFGQVGVDPGSAWTDANNSEFSTANKTLRRKNSVAEGDVNHTDEFPGVENQWLVFDQNTSNGLGCGGEEACPDTGNPTNPPGNPDAGILITEYVEGSSNNKAVEISNLSDVNVDLAAEGYRLEAFNNGGTDISNGLNLYGILVPNSSIVVYNGGAVADVQKAAPQGIASNVTYFNGDDALVLSKNGVVVDSFGQKGFDPGSEWLDDNDASFSTKDTTLRRKVSVLTGDVTVDDNFPGSNNEWLSFDTNTFDGLGCVGEDACTGNEPQPLPGEGAPGDGTTPGDGLCLNCPDITKVADASLFVDADYYAAALNVDNSELRSVVNGIISANHKKLSYSEVWSVLTHSDEDPANPDNVIEIYTGNSIAKWSNGSGAQSSNPDAWNREHVWSKSHGFPGRSQYGYTDAHHLRPADASMNSTRSNYDFDNGGVAVAESPENFYDTSLRTWEPRDAVKGDVARMMFYMDVRYEGTEGEDTPDLILVDNIGTENGSPTFGKLCTLYQWHLTDTVDDMERQRNDAVYEYQGNRNPFIDHPEWADAIFGPACGDTGTVEPPVNEAPVIDIYGKSVFLEGEVVYFDASKTTDAESDELTFTWTQISGPDVNYKSGQPQLTFATPDVRKDTEMAFELTVSDGENTVSEQVSFTVEFVPRGASFGLWALLLLPVIALRRRFK